MEIDSYRVGAPRARTVLIEAFVTCFLAYTIFEKKRRKPVRNSENLTMNRYDSHRLFALINTTLTNNTNANSLAVIIAAFFRLLNTPDSSIELLCHTRNSN